jgi:BirA family transcriptional regulator, biotin operon repressor / biotin---[acetyl-CoA-carboxylase] ligase
VGEGLLATNLRALLERNGTAWPGPIEWAPALPSTNDRLKEWCRAGAPEWAVVLAGEQTSGRGRQGNTWASPRGNLFLSALLRPRFTVQTLGLVPLAAGVAVAEALRSLGAASEVKWPNDILMGGRKVGGILAEATWIEGKLEAVVVGVGVNVALDPSTLAEPGYGGATSLAVELGRSFPVESVAGPVLEQLALWYHRLTSEGAEAIVEAWRGRAVPWWGRPVEVGVGDGALRGVARGIDETGALLLEGADGTIRPVVAGEARALRLR